MAACSHGKKRKGSRWSQLRRRITATADLLPDCCGPPQVAKHRPSADVAWRAKAHRTHGHCDRLAGGVESRERDASCGHCGRAVRLLERAPSHSRGSRLEPLAAHFETADGCGSRPREPVRCALLREGGGASARSPGAAALLGAARVPSSRMAVIDGAWEWTSALTGVEHPGVVLGKPTDCTHYCLWSGVSDALLDAIATQLNGPWAVRQQAGYHRRLQGGFRVPGEAQPIRGFPRQKRSRRLRRVVVVMEDGGPHCSPRCAKLCSALRRAPRRALVLRSRCGCDACRAGNGDVPRSSRGASGKRGF